MSNEVWKSIESEGFNPSPSYFFISSGARGVFVAGSVAVVLSFSEPVGVGFSGVRSDVSEFPGWPGGLVDAGVSPGPLVGVSPAIAAIVNKPTEAAVATAIILVRMFLSLSCKAEEPRNVEGSCLTGAQYWLRAALAWYWNQVCGRVVSR